MTRPGRVLVLPAGAFILLASCRDDTQRGDRSGSSAAALAGLSAAARAGDTAARRALAARRAAPPQAMPDSAPLGAHRAAELEAAATDIVRFLRGEVGFDRIRVADTVTFYVSPEGGGARTTITRQQLRDRANWKVPVLGIEPSLVPARRLTTLTTRVGRHFRCHEHPLSSILPELARLPHVGTRMDPGEGSNCLQIWNLTFVFDPDAKPPTLVAAVYDQWEW